MQAASELTGKRFGRLTVTEKTDERKRGYVVWLCRCDCGNVVRASSEELKLGRAKDCGVCGCGRPVPRHYAKPNTAGFTYLF